MDVHASREAGDCPRDPERPEPLAHDRDPDRPRDCRILTGCAELTPQPAALVCEGDEDRDERAHGRLEETRRLRHRRERIRARPDPVPVAQDVVRDLEHGEGGDSGDEAREAHQRHADEQRIDTTHARRCEQRADVPDRGLAEEPEEARIDRGLFFDGDRKDTGRPGADGDEADVPEREDPRVPDEDVQGDHHDHRHEGVDEVDLRLSREGGAEKPDSCEHHHRAEQRRRTARDGHTRSTVVPRANSPVGRINSTRITSPKSTEGRY
jgi:hypothetical protein